MNTRSTTIYQRQAPSPEYNMRGNINVSNMIGNILQFEEGCQGTGYMGEKENMHKSNIELPAAKQKQPTAVLRKIKPL